MRAGDIAFTAVVVAGLAWLVIVPRRTRVRDDAAVLADRYGWPERACRRLARPTIRQELGLDLPPEPPPAIGATGGSHEADPIGKIPADYADSRTGLALFAGPGPSVPTRAVHSPAHGGRLVTCSVPFYGSTTPAPVPWTAGPVSSVSAATETLSRVTAKG